MQRKANWKRDINVVEAWLGLAYSQIYTHFHTYDTGYFCIWWYYDLWWKPQAQSGLLEADKSRWNYISSLYCITLLIYIQRTTIIPLITHNYIVRYVIYINSILYVGQNVKVYVYRIVNANRYPYVGARQMEEIEAKCVFCADNRENWKLVW